jgi:prepilin-type processing-associated H-X9-DG protein
MHHSFSPVGGRKAFSRIEFLGTLVVLGILAIVLFPLFGKPGPNPSRAYCQSNLKQIGLGMTQYTQDYNGRFPQWQRGNNLSTGWSAIIQPYIRKTEALQCPAETTASDSHPGKMGYCDYFYNSNIGTRPKGTEDGALASPSSTILFGDAATFSSGNTSNGGTLTSERGLAVAQGQWDPAVSGLRHVGGANYGYADGHVKWLKPEGVTREPTSAGKATFRRTAKKPPISGS